MNKIDDLFKKKLEDLTLDPSGEAWIKLNANLTKKNSGLIWFSAAAAIFLLGILVASIIWLEKRELNQLETEQSQLLPTNSSNTNKLIADSIGKSLVAEANKITKVKRKSPPLKARTIKPLILPINVNEIEVEPSATEILLTETVVEVTIKEKPIVIEYRLESILPQQKEAPLVAEAIEKKNGFQKALEFAREAKNSDSPLGDIRQAKDDLFALNFKKDKQKKQ